MEEELTYKRPVSVASISIVLPAYNEAENIINVIQDSVTSARSVSEKYEIIVVNDGSDDNTAEIVTEYAAKNNNVKLLNNPYNLGYGLTVRRGLASAIMDWVFFTDADNQFELSEIKKLVRYSDTYDFVVGRRVKRKDTLHRRFNAKLFKLASRVFFGVRVKDIDCAFKLMKRTKLHNIELLSESAMINTEILHRAKIAGLRIKQVPVTHKPRVAGTATGGDSNVIRRAIKEFYTLRWILLKSTQARLRLNTRIVFLSSLLLGIAATIWSYHYHVILAYGDAEAHLNIAKRVTTSLTPGAAQLGGIWLPLPHLLMAPFVAMNPLWTSGIGGSIVSVAAFVLLCVYLYRFAYLLTGKFMASYIAPLVVMLNPNSLYLATTPMTEILLLSMFTASVYYFARWLKSQKLLHLILASLFTFLASLSRYDGWALVVMEAGLLGLYLILKRKSYKIVEGVLFLYSFVAFMGIILWLAWNKVIFNSFTYFSNSVYGSKEQQQFFLQSGYLPTYHNLGKSFHYFFEDIRLVVGTPVLILAGLGLLFFMYRLIKNKQYRYLAVIVLTLTPIFFYVLSLYIGQASLILPTLAKSGAKYTISNVRYGVQILLFVAVFTAYLGSKYKKTIPLILLILGVQAAAFIRTDSVITYVDGTRGLSSQAVSKGPDAPLVEQYMRQHYDKGLVLMDDYRRPIGPVESGIPMQDFIGSGNKPYWNDSFDDPGKHADWVILQKSDTDAIWKGLKRKDLLDQEFVNVYRSNYLYVYKKKVPENSFVQRAGQHLTLNKKSFVFSGMNSYDILAQSQNEIDRRIHILKLSHMNSMRIWCFNKQGSLDSHDYQNFDYLLHTAQLNDIKIICVFGNTYDDYGGPLNFGASNNEQFFTSSTAEDRYRTYILSILDHKSAYDNRPLKDNGTIAAWEIINEPRLEGQPNSKIMTTWMEGMSQYVAGLDQKHLISPGSEGFTTSYSGQAYNEAHGSSIEDLCTIESITLCSGHLYPKYYPSTSGAINYSAVGTTIHTWRELADKYNKPFYIGEVGYDLSAGTAANRLTYFQNVHNSLIANKLDGGLIWNLGTVSDSTYTLDYKDVDTKNIITTWSARAPNGDK